MLASAVKCVWDGLLGHIIYKVSYLNPFIASNVNEHGGRAKRFFAVAHLASINLGWQVERRLTINVWLCGGADGVV